MKYIGIIPDTRPNSQKKKDYKDTELASSMPFEWVEKKKWKSYTERNQHKTNSCVAQSASKMLEVLNKVEENKTVVFSASPIYAKRNNKPHAGMSMPDVFDIVKKQGTTLEKNIQSQMLTSDAMMEEKAKNWTDTDTEIANKYGIEAYAYVDNNSIDIMAGHIEAGRPVMLFIYADKPEYTEFPKIKNYNLDPWSAFIRHAVVAVDYGLIDGKKYLKIEDSAHFNKKSVRYFDGEWIDKRVYGAGVFFDRKNELLPKKTRYTFNSDMQFGEQSKEVAKWQDFLKQQGHFPVVTKSTGYYGEITRKATEEFQIKNQVASLWELLVVKGKRVGKKTRDFANNM